MVTANSRKSAQNLIKAQLKEGNRFAVILISDAFGANTLIDVIEEFGNLGVKAPYIVLREQKDIPMRHYLRPDLSVKRVLDIPYEDADLQQSVRMLCDNLLLKNQVEGFRETLEAMYENMEERIDAGINDLSGRRDYLSALVQSRMEHIRTTLFEAQHNLPALQEMIEFTDSIKPQMSTNEKKKVGPKLLTIQTALQNYEKLDTLLVDLFQVGSQEFSLKRMVLHYFMRRWSALKKFHIEIEEEIASEIRVLMDEAMLAAIFRYLMLFFLKNLPDKQEACSLLIKAYPEGVHVNFELIGRGFQVTQEQVHEWLDSNGNLNDPLCYPTALNVETIKEFLRLNQAAFDCVSTQSSVHFTLSLPASKTYLTLLNSLQHAEASIDLSHVRVLLVENSDIQMLMMVKKLSLYGLDINVCSSGYDALELAKQNAYDYIFINIGMEGLDGYHTSEMVSSIQHQRGASPEIILMAVKFEEINKRRMKEVRATRIITKPVRPEILKEVFWTKIAFQLREEEELKDVINQV